MSERLSVKFPADPCEADTIIAETAEICDALKASSGLITVPKDISEMLDAIAEQPGTFLVSKRDIRMAGGAYEMIVSLEPTPLLRSFMATLRTWVSESDVVHVFDVAG